MRTISPRQLALYVSFIIAIVSTGLLILYRQIQFSTFLLPIIGSFIIVCSITYLVSYFTINNFIFEKINPIYKTIENIPLTKEKLRKKLGGKDVIQEVNSLAINWARNKTKEIKKLRRLERYRKENIKYFEILTTYN